MKQNNKIICIFVFIFITSLLMPKIVLYLLEDNNMNNIYVTNSNIFNTNNLKSKNPIINTVYSKYSNVEYNVTTRDSFEYSDIYVEIEDEIIINDTLTKLKELEEIGLIKASFFEYIKSNTNIISRINDFNSESITYSKTRIFLSNDNYSNVFMSFEVEKISEKIIDLKIPKEHINSSKDVIENYIKYLGLEDGTWNYESNSIKSLYNHIEIKVEDINNLLSISIVPYNN